MNLSDLNIHCFGAAQAHKEAWYEERIKELEEQISLRDEMIIQKNKELLNSHKMLNWICDYLDGEPYGYWEKGKREDLEWYVEEYLSAEEWKEIIKKGAQND